MEYASLSLPTDPLEFILAVTFHRKCFLGVINFSFYGNYYSV